ncbi:MAG TPA: site-2 protease family protein [Pirellulales bacterium]|nr:site-2 protease family protein [Pirellulales bacterium]
MDQEGDKSSDAEGSAKPDGGRQPVDAASVTPVPAPKPSFLAEPVYLAELVPAPGGGAPRVAVHQGPPPAPPQNQQRRYVKLPVVLFFATCFSTFFVGMTGWDFLALISEPVTMLRENWWQGMAYMLSVMSILLAHEMGHFLQAVRYGVPASLPFFIPLPITPLGTMGAVIALGGSQANRKQLFDIGLTGPLAGLALALPLTCVGLIMATPLPASSDASLGGMHFGDPLVFKILVAWLRPDVPADSRLIVLSNPLLFAGWVGMLVTGLNMLAMGQLDGGHVAYALMGKRSYWLARGMVLASIAFIVVTGQYTWSAMLGLIVFMGIHHPPTANDRVELGLGRTVLGWLSLSIPLFCFPPFPIVPS